LAREKLRKNQIRLSKTIALLKTTTEELDDAKELLAATKSKLDQKTEQADRLLFLYHSVSHSTFWRVTKPLRLATQAVKSILRKLPGVNLLYKTLYHVRRSGVKSTLVIIRAHLFKKRQTVIDNSPFITEDERHRQTRTKFKNKVKISVIVPLYQTPKAFLQEMIASVLEQTYANWELCLADGSDRDDGLEKICLEYASKDKRILYKKIGANLGISENTNQALQMATGDYCALLDHDDLIHPSALFEIVKAINDTQADFIYTDEDKFTNNLYDRHSPRFKPDFSPDMLRSFNYITHMIVFSKSLLEKVGSFQTRFNGSQDYDITLRCSEQANKIVHIPRILYHWRVHNESTASSTSSKSYAIPAAKLALAEHLKRSGLEGQIEDGKIVSYYKIKYIIKGEPLISIIIPNKDEVATLAACLDSILTQSTYKNFEILIVENNSVEEGTFTYYASQSDPRIRVINWGGSFNFSAIINYGVSLAKGDYYIFLNNDIEVITKAWIEEMLAYAQRPDVGAVGAKLYYPDDTIQHAGVIFGLGGCAGHSHKNYPRWHPGYDGRLTVTQNLSAVTAACLMLSKKVFQEVQGFEEKLQVAFNDVDLCLKIRKLGYLIVFTPFAELYHYESKSRGAENTQEKCERFTNEVKLIQTKWLSELRDGDPYYNPNLTLDREDFAIKEGRFAN
jgi:glycosyltransferase involved in cell wall biosynthesis